MALKMYGVSVCVVCSAPGLRGLGLPHMWPRNIEHCIVSCALFDTRLWIKLYSHYKPFKRSSLIVDLR